MAYVVTEACIKCKYSDCVEVCPQGAFREGMNFVVIDPNLCANCALCEMVCPVNAIYPSHDLPAGQEEYRELNANFSKMWPKAHYRMAPADADSWANQREKRAALDERGFSD